MSEEKFSIPEIIEDWYYANSEPKNGYRVLYSSKEERDILIRKLIARIKEVGYSREDILRSHISLIVNKCVGTVKDRKKKLFLTEVVEQTINAAIYEFFGGRAYKDPKIEPVAPQKEKKEHYEPIVITNPVTEEDRDIPSLSLADHVDHEFCDFLGVPRSHRE